MAKGNRYDVACPHCGKFNHYVDQLAGELVPEKKSVDFDYPCYSCDRVVYYRAYRGKVEDGSREIIIFSYEQKPEPIPG